MNNMTFPDLSKLHGYAFSRHPFGDIRIEDKGNYYAYAHTHFVVHPSRPTFTPRVVDFYEQPVSFVDGDTLIFNTFIPYDKLYCPNDMVRACDMGNGQMLVSGHTCWHTQIGEEYEITDPVKVKVIPHKHTLININTRLQAI